MIVTEEEATTKICCGGDGCGTIVTIKTGLVEDNYERRCMGSACMAWRWQWQISGATGTHHHIFASNGGKLGYCGKAGPA